MVLPEVVVEQDVDDGVEHGVKVRHELDPELVGRQPQRGLQQ